MAEFKEGNLLLDNDKGVYFGNTQEASIAYDAETNELVFSAFRTSGLTKVYYTMREFGTTTIPSGSRYVDISFNGEQFPTASYTSVFQLISNDFYPAYISEKSATGFRVEIMGTAKEDIGVDYLCVANQFENPISWSILAVPTSSGLTHTPTYSLTTTNAETFSLEKHLKLPSTFEVPPRYTLNNYYFATMTNQASYALSGNTLYFDFEAEPINGSYGYSRPVMMNILAGDLFSTLGGLTDYSFLSNGVVSGTETVALFPITRSGGQFTSPLVFITIQDQAGTGNVQYPFTVQKTFDGTVWTITINFMSPIQSLMALQVNTIEGA